MSSPLAAIESWPVGTAAAAVVGPDGVLATHGPTAHRFALASVTKPLSVLGALVAVEEEAIALSDTVLTEILDGATVRHLMSHASGLSPDRRNRAAAPGTRRIYSNLGIELLGAAVEAASGIGFADYLREAVFEPLGMADTSLPGSPARDGISTVADLCAVLTQLLGTGAKLLHPDTLAAAARVQFPGIRGVVPGYGMQDPNDWGLGFEIKGSKAPHWTGAANTSATYGHFGQAGTMFWVDPVARLGLVALADREFGPWAAEAWPALSDAALAAYADG